MTIPSQFQPINHWTDVTPFANTIVTVNSPSNYFSKEAAYTYEGNPHTFAHVTEQPLDFFSGGEGYHLNTLYKIQALRSTAIVNQLTLREDGPLSLRLASKDELDKIRDAISSSLASFSEVYDHNSNENARAILYPSKIKKDPLEDTQNAASVALEEGIIKDGFLRPKNTK